MKITKLILLIFFVLLFFRPRPAAAYDGWVEITPAIVEKGQVSMIVLLHGNHSNEHRSYRIAGKWDQKYTTVFVFDPQGKQNALTDRLIDLGEDAEKTGPKGPKGFYLAPFTSKEEGLYQALVRQVRTLQREDGPKFLSIRTAKTAFAALSVPTVAAAKNLKGFDHALGGEDGLEIIPLTNPLGIFSKDSVALELRHKGKPIGGKEISLIRRIDSAASAQDRATDDKGRVTFVVGPADSYLARVKFDVDSPRPDGQIDKSSYEATYVFQVFNRP